MWRYWTWHFRGRLDISKVSERPKNGQGEHQSIKQKKLYRECRLALDLVKKVRIWTNINHNTDSNTGFSRFNFSISRLSPENVVLMAPVHRIMITYQFKQDIVQICPYFKNSIWRLYYRRTVVFISVLTRIVPRRQSCQPCPPRPWGPRWGWPPEGWPYCHPHPHPASRKILI